MTATHDITVKAQSLLSHIDLDRPELAAVKAAPDPAAALVAHLATPPRPRYAIEHERKGAIVAFLTEHYQSWRAFDTGPAQKYVDMSIAEAQRPRGTGGISALGRAWWATGDEKFGRAFERFYLETATGEMFTWGDFNASQSKPELHTWFLLQDCPGFSTEGRIAYLDHLIQISYDAWDERCTRWSQLGLGPEGHNWYLHGMHTLPHVGLLFPEFKRSAYFVRSPWSMVEEHVRGHLKSDGGARETTLGYQAGSMLCLWDMYLNATRNGWPTSPGMADRLLHATKFVLRLATPIGSLPSFGDTQPSRGQLMSLAAFAAAVTGDGECKWYAQRDRALLPADKGDSQEHIPLDAFWYVGLAGAATYANTRAKNPKHTSVFHGMTGYAAMRDSDATDATYLAIAAAERGPIVTSHGHNDIFAVEMHAFGTKFIGEAGCAPYGDSPGRRYDQITEAHNTLDIEGNEQVPVIDEWRWAHQLMPALRRWISEPTHDFFHGSHEGFYAYRQHETIHARKVVFFKPIGDLPAYAVVFDWVESNIERDYRVHFHGCVPGRLDDRAITLTDDQGARLWIAPPSGDKLTCRQVASDGLTAYLNEKKLDPANHPHFTYSKSGLSDCFIWVLMPLAKGAAQPRVQRLPVTFDSVAVAPGVATAVRIEHATGADSVCISHKDYDGELAFGDDTAFGHLSIRRRDARGSALVAVDHTMADGVTGR